MAEPLVPNWESSVKLPVGGRLGVSGEPPATESFAEFDTSGSLYEATHHFLSEAKARRRRPRGAEPLNNSLLSPPPPNRVGDGKLNSDEVARLFKSFGCDVSEGKVAGIFKVIDTDHSGRIGPHCPPLPHILSLAASSPPSQHSELPKEGVVVCLCGVCCVCVCVCVCVCRAWGLTLTLPRPQSMASSRTCGGCSRWKVS